MDLASLVRSLKPFDAVAVAKALCIKGATTMDEVVIAVDSNVINKDLLMKAGAREVQAIKFLRAAAEAHSRSFKITS